MRIANTLSVSMLLLVVAGGVSTAGALSLPQGDVASAGSEASSEVQAMLADVPHLLEIGRYKEALTASNQAFELARQRSDQPGVALAQRSRAGALLRLKRTEEALASWREATGIWQELGDGPREVESLASTGVLLLAQNAESAEGRELIDRALALAKEEEADHPLQTAQAFYDAGETAFAAKQRDSAIRLFSEAVSILDKHAPASVALVESLIGLGRAETGRGRDPAPALTALERGLEIARQVAPGSALEANCLAMMGSVHKTNQDFPVAVGLYLEALAIQDSVDPDGHDTSSTLIDVAMCEAWLGNLDDARSHTLRALSIREGMEADPLQLAACFSSLGIFDLWVGDLDAAEANFERVVEISRQYSDEPVRLAEALINLGNVFASRWQFAAARKNYEEALALLEQHAPTYDAVGKALGNIREICLVQGDYEAAESYTRAEVAFFEEHYPDSVELARAWTGAGNLAQKRGDFRTAKGYHERALEIRDRLVPGSGDVVDSLTWLGLACLDLNELDDAEKHLRRAFEIYGGENATGETAAGIASFLGEVTRRRGDLEVAERYHRRALQLERDYGGPGYPPTSGPLFFLAVTLRERGRAAEAFDAVLEAAELHLSYVRTSSRTLTEREALAYGEGARGSLSLVLTLAAEAGDKIPAASGRAYDTVIRWRAVVLDEVAARNREVWSAIHPGLVEEADAYRLSCDQLARLVIQGPQGEDVGAYQEALTEARAAKDQAERALASKSSEFRRELAMDQGGFDEVAGSMAAAGALVAYVRFERIAPPSAAAHQAPAGIERIPAYAAFVLPQGSTELVLVPLGSAEEIDALVAELRRQISSALLAGQVVGKRTTDQYRSVGVRLRERVWDPVAGKIGDSDRVFVVPDGALNLVELAALPVGDSEYLVETGPRIHYLSAERDVLAFEEDPGKGGLLALGDPAFDEPSLFAALAPEGAAVKLDESYRVASAGAYRGPRSSCAGFASMHFEPLPDTGDEVDEVVRLWRSQAKRQTSGAGSSEAIRLRGASASEAAFKNLASSARLIHLATHGFFLGEGCPSATDGSRSTTVGGVAPAVTGESPLLLSGFALAGANHRDAAGPDEEDGILTAEEIAALNLTQVHWAVLSACDTGVGEVRVGEGVFGLRRAFQVAGARTLIMSLWPVEDETTRQWMKALYQNRFAKGMSTIDAVHEANLAVLQTRREAGLSTHPAFWAGFIASGDWQ
jgi:tetratricopeptide (TPR) repeat protein/CHAT domain-containing protein